MIARRTFLKTSVATAFILALGKGRSAQAAAGSKYAGVVYTKDNAGKWAKKVGSHAPVVTVKGNTVTVETKHGMSEDHYIVRHTLVLADGTVVDGKTFTHTDKPVSTYTLPKGYKGTFVATSFCNKHDFWLTEHTI
jgi:superoxide reductase